MHVCIHHEDVVHHEATCDALLRRANSFINNFTEGEFEARADDFNKGVGEVERAEVKRGVDFETGGGGKESLLGKEDEKGEEELGIETLVGKTEEREKGKDERHRDGRNVFIGGVGDSVRANP